MIYSKIIGTGSYFPKNIITNSDLAKIVDTSDEWIVTRTGIHTRHKCGEDESTVSMSYEASLKAIEMANIDKNDIDGIIFATLTPDYAMPCAAAMLQNRLGISKQFAFDLNTACTGFVYSLHIADAMIKAGQCETILIACSERLTSTVDYTDRSSCILFGDGAGSVIVSKSDTPGLLSSAIHADGSFGDILHLKALGSTFLANRDTMKIEENLMQMNGNEVFKQAVRGMSEVIVDVLEKSGLKSEDIDFVVPHQANIRIIDAIAKRLNIDIDNVLINIDRRGNCSSATIPTALDEGIRSGRVKLGDNLIMPAFGGGMSWGAAVIKL